MFRLITAYMFVTPSIPFFFERINSPLVYTFSAFSIENVRADKGVGIVFRGTKRVAVGTK
jgi:hypothetical protein